MRRKRRNLVNSDCEHLAPLEGLHKQPTFATVISPSMVPGILTTALAGGISGLTHRKLPGAITKLNEMKQTKSGVKRTCGSLAHGNAVRLMRQGRILITVLSECQQNRYSLTFPSFGSRRAAQFDAFGRLSASKGSLLLLPTIEKTEGKRQEILTECTTRYGNV
jgi:hypothetical protein